MQEIIKNQIRMKRKMIFVAVAILIGFTNVAKAQEDMDVRVNSPQVNVYGFIYSYSAFDSKYKEIYVSNIIRGSKYGKKFINASTTDLKLQWDKYLKTVIDDYFSLRYTVLDYAFFTDYDDVDEYRIKIIGEYKQKGYSIQYMDDFYYRKTKFPEGTFR
jgi:hypothetical protein